MRRREAMRAVRRFLDEHYPMYAEAYFDLGEESDGERAKSWSFGVHFDEENPRYDRDSEIDGVVGYVHANGTVEGLYGSNPKAYEAYERGKKEVQQ